MINNEFMKTDVAIEIIAEMLANITLALLDEKDEKIILELNEKKKLYSKQRDEVYSGNKETINYVIEVYGPELKKQR